MAMFTSRKQEATTPTVEPSRPSPNSDSNRAAPAPQTAGGLLSGGVSINGTVKFKNALLIDGQVEGAIDSTGELTVGQNAKIRGEVRARSVKVRGTVEGNIFASERCELQAGCTLRGDIEAPRLVVDENATFLGSAKIATK